MFGSLSLFIKELGSLCRYLGAPSGRRRLTFYSERAVYFQYFEDFIREILATSDLEICYISSDISDKRLAWMDPRIHVYYADKLMPLFLLLSDAAAWVMTMTDLHQFHVRRSVAGAHHVYLFHAMVSTHMIYRKGAFDHYDTLLCAGPHHVREIQRAEEIYRLPAKRLLETGYPLLDKIRAESASRKRNHGEPRTVLVAPSWAPGNIMESCVRPLVSALAGKGWRIILRPHPEFLKRKRDVIDSLRADLLAYTGVEMETEFLNKNSIHDADVLITDWSGIGLEYAFGTERPVLYIDTPRKVTNPEYERLGLPPIEEDIREKIGTILSMGDCGKAPEAIESMLLHCEKYCNRIRELRENLLFNPGRSASVGARQIVAMAKEEEPVLQPVLKSD